MGHYFIIRQICRYYIYNADNSRHIVLLNCLSLHLQFLIHYFRPSRCDFAKLFSRQRSYTFYVVLLTISILKVIHVLHPATFPTATYISSIGVARIVYVCSLKNIYRNDEVPTVIIWRYRRRQLSTVATRRNVDQAACKSRLAESIA